MLLCTASKYHHICVAAVLITFEEKLPDILLKKYVQSVNGSATRVDEHKIIVEFEDSEGRVKHNSNIFIYR